MRCWHCDIAIFCTFLLPVFVTQFYFPADYLIYEYSWVIVLKIPANNWYACNMDESISSSFLLEKHNFGIFSIISYYVFVSIQSYHYIILMWLTVKLFVIFSSKKAALLIPEPPPGTSRIHYGNQGPMARAKIVTYLVVP